MFSAVHPTTDIAKILRHVRFVPTSDRSRMVAQSAGDRKLKKSTPRLAPGRPQPPTMGFDNRAADREAHAHAVGLRRVEGFKDTRQALRAQPGRAPGPRTHQLRTMLKKTASSEARKTATATLMTY